MVVNSQFLKVMLIVFLGCASSARAELYEYMLPEKVAEVEALADQFAFVIGTEEEFLRSDSDANFQKVAEKTRKSDDIKITPGRVARSGPVGLGCAAIGACIGFVGGGAASVFTGIMGQDMSVNWEGIWFATKGMTALGGGVGFVVGLQATIFPESSFLGIQGLSKAQKRTLEEAFFNRLASKHGFDLPEPKHRIQWLINLSDGFATTDAHYESPEKLREELLKFEITLRSLRKDLDDTNSRGLLKSLDFYIEKIEELKAQKFDRNVIGVSFLRSRRMREAVQFLAQIQKDLFDLAKSYDSRPQIKKALLDLRHQSFQQMQDRIRKLEAKVANLVTPKSMQAKALHDSLKIGILPVEFVYLLRDLEKVDLDVTHEVLRKPKGSGIGTIPGIVKIKATYTPTIAGKTLSPVSVEVEDAYTNEKDINLVFDAATNRLWTNEFPAALSDSIAKHSELQALLDKVPGLKGVSALNDDKMDYDRLIMLAHEMTMTGLPDSGLTVLCKDAIGKASISD